MSGNNFWLILGHLLGPTRPIPVRNMGAHQYLPSNRRFSAMTTIEEAIIEKLRSSGPCCLDDVVTYLPHLNWEEVFVAINRLSRDRR